MTVALKRRAHSRPVGGKRAAAVSVLLLALAIFSPLLLSQAEAPEPIEGIVVDITQIGNDVFVQLDLNEDGKGEVWVKLADVILDMLGNALTPNDIALGARLKLITYQKNETGFIEAQKVVVLSNPSDPNSDNALGTMINVFARIPGSPPPSFDLFDRQRDAWICLGEQVELYWVTTPDVTQISLGESLGTFPAARGGEVKGLNWGSIVVQPTQTINIVAATLDGTFRAANAVSVFVFGPPVDPSSGRTPPEGKIQATLVGNTARINEVDDWKADLPASRYSANVQISDIKPLGEAVEFGFTWRIQKVDTDQTVHNFSIAATEVYQHPFRPAGTDLTLSAAGQWTFSTPANVVTKTVDFAVRPVCPQQEDARNTPAGGVAH